jgi:DEAD/DEAH box helicase domain-containing protein
MAPYFFLQKLPSHAVNIRAIETVRYNVIDQRKNEVLEEIEGKARLSFRY